MNDIKDLSSDIASKIIGNKIKNIKFEPEEVDERYWASRDIVIELEDNYSLIISVQKPITDEEEPTFEIEINLIKEK